MISRLKARKNRNKQAKSWHYIYVKFPMRLREINDLRAARRLALSKTDLTPAVPRTRPGRKGQGAAIDS